jgi:rapamycin-insensitive companion of mTOR
MRSRSPCQSAPAESADRSNAAHDPLQRGQRQVQSVKLRLGLQVEDKQFQQMIVDTGVSDTKSPSPCRSG